jgi:hypothetical protein
MATMALTTGYTSPDDYGEAVTETGLLGWKAVAADDAADKLEQLQPDVGSVF